MSSYEVRARRDGKWWMVEIPALNGLTQARRFTEVEHMARDFIALTLDVPIESVAVEISVAKIAGINVEQRLAKIRKNRRTATELEQAALADTEQLAKELAAHDLTVREIGEVLDISFQRAHQLIRA